MKLMWHYTMRYKKLLVCNIICVFGFILIELGLPTLLAKMIDEGIAKKDFAKVAQIGWLMLLICMVGLLGLIALAYCGSRLASNIVRDIRNDIFEKVQSFSHDEFDQMGVSSLLTRTTNDAFQVMTFLQMVLRTGFMTPLMFVFSIIMVVRTSPNLSVLVFGALPFLIVGVLIVGKISEPLSKKQQENLDHINMDLRENLSGLRVIRAFVRERFQEKRFAKVNEAYAESSKKLFKLMAFAQPGFSFAFNIVFALVVWNGAIQINNGHLLIGNLVAFVEYIFHALFSFMLFAGVFMLYPRAAVSANRIQAVLDMTPAIKNPENGVTKTETNGVVVFDHVTFAYPGNTESPVIRDVSFTAKPGETVAFIGSTGSGKSTLIQLIPRLYDVTKGQVLIDGIDVRSYDLAALREKIGYVPQKATLFTGTIAENLQFGKSTASEEEQWAAVRTAQSKSFIAGKENGLESFLAEGGSNLSGGQKQRLAIARAITRRPAIYIFDDSFSALDYRTDMQLRSQLKKETQDATVLIVAQRVGTIMHADKIIVLDEGNVVGMGTHQALLKNCSIYYDIAASQLSKEELA